MIRANAGIPCIVGTICARGGSKGVPGKNVRLLRGQPLIAHTIEHALSSRSINAGVYVSTDDPVIAEIAVKVGAEVPYLRPGHLATDQAPKVPVIEHLVAQLESVGKHVDIIVDLDPTSPLRDVGDVERACDRLVDPYDLVISATRARKNPYFNLIELGDDGCYHLSKGSPNPPASRQDAPSVYEINGSIYVYRRRALQNGLWGNKIAIYEMPPERSVDIDSEVDFRLVELLMNDRQSKRIAEPESTPRG